MAQVEVFSTAALPAHRRIDYWNALTGDALTQLVADPLDRERFCGQLTLTEVGRIRLAELYSEAATVRHERHHIARAQDGKFFLCLQLDGMSVYRQQGREAVLRYGDYTLTDSTRPYEVTFHEPNRTVVLCIPQCELRRRMAAPESVLARAMPGGESLSGLLSSLLTRFWQQRVATEEMLLGPRFGEAILDLLASSYEPLTRSEALTSSLGLARREQVRGFIESHLHDPRLTPRRIAQALSMSTRYLHHVFNDDGETVSRYVQRRRLDECARALSDPAQVARTVTDIAFGFGFNDASHFGRVFRARYGLTPREYRRRGAFAPGRV